MGRLRKAAFAAAAWLGVLGAAGQACAAPAMWVARDADSEIYLFGSMHVLEPGSPWRTAAYDRAYALAQSVWFEADIDTADPAAMRGLIARYGVDPERTLSQKLSPAELSALTPLLDGGRVSLAQIDHLRPWAAALVLSMQPMLRRGGEVGAGADAAMTHVARADAKPVRTFETIEDQVRMFASLPEPVEIQYLSDVIRERAAPRRRGERSLQAAWISGEVDRLGDGLVAAMRRDSPAFYDVLLRRRNLAWADAISAEMAGSGVELVNVGALHLVGPDGLPELLRARGYTVERVQ